MEPKSPQDFPSVDKQFFPEIPAENVEFFMVLIHSSFGKHRRDFPTCVQPGIPFGPCQEKTLEQTTRTAAKIGNRDFTWTGNPGKAKGIYGMKRMENFSYLVKLGLVLAVFQHSGVEGKPWRGKKRENSWIRGWESPEFWDLRVGNGWKIPPESHLLREAPWPRGSSLLQPFPIQEHPDFSWRRNLYPPVLQEVSMSDIPDFPAPFPRGSLSWRLFTIHP